MPGLKKEEPRSGKRKPVEESDEEKREDQAFMKDNNILNNLIDVDKIDNDKQQKEPKDTIIRAPQT